MISALIIDPDENARDSLKRLLAENLGEVSVCGHAAAIDEGYRMIRDTRPDLVFMETEMPHGSAFELIQKLGKIDFRIIFVTSHPQYAIKAIKFEAAGYLLKPVDIDELVSAVNRVCEKGCLAHDSSNITTAHADNHKPCKIAVPVKDGVVYIAPEEVVRMQADGTYTHIYTTADKFTATKNIKEFEDLLKHIYFFRSHHSHLINLYHVRRFSRSDGFFVMMSNGSLAEISRRKKEEFMDVMMQLGA
jgi:two-component system LytT family response regulator